MPDEINFLPEKEKEIKEKQQAKKAKSRVRFHTPKFEEPKKGKEGAAFSTVVSFLNNIKSSFKEIFKIKKKKTSEVDAKKPMQLTAKPVKPTDKIQAKKITAEIGIKPSTSGKEPTAAPPLPPARPMAGMPDDLGGEYSEVDVNLMPWQDPGQKRLRQLGISLLVVSITVIAVWGTVLRINNNNKAQEIEQLTNSIEVIDKQLAAINVDLFSQSSDIGLRKREFINLFLATPRWSKFLSWLEANTNKLVYFKDFSASETEFSVPVVAPDYDTAVQQWLAFRNATAWVDSVFVAGISGSSDLEEPSAKFEAVITFKRDVLKINSEDL